MISAALPAVAEATRLKAMCCLADGSEHCICEQLCKRGATQSWMSRHMQVFKQAGMVVDRRDTQWVAYQIDPDLSPPVVRLVEETPQSSVSVEESAA
jgi:ArsR family transcriptional regulator, arsenate/arsenite/antimonite-responsive transcriptional repressor